MYVKYANKSIITGFGVLCVLMASNYGYWFVYRKGVYTVQFSHAYAYLQAY